MIPTSYLAKDLYRDAWGDPRNPHAVDVPAVVHLPRAGDQLGGLGRREPDSRVVAQRPLLFSVRSGLDNHDQTGHRGRCATCPPLTLTSNDAGQNPEPS